MKILKRILLWMAVLLLILVVVSAVASYLLYRSADAQRPDTSQIELQEQPLVLSDSLRTYGSHSLLRSESGLWELYVHGAPYERGVAIGKMSEDLLYHQEKVFVDAIMEVIPSERYLKFLRYLLVIFDRDLGKHIPLENREEILGISEYCTHEFDAIGTSYERQLHYHAAHDIGHMMQGYMLVGCTSFALWGERSADGQLLLGRNFDFYFGDDFAKHKQVAFYAPTEGYRFACVGWPAMTGVLSGMNERGLTVTINAAQDGLPTKSATPISILTRIILQYAQNIEEAYEIAQKYDTFVAESILVGSAQDGRAVVIEKSPHRMALLRRDSGVISCTNHYQSPDFQNDLENLDNIKNTDSQERLARLDELLAQPRAKSVEDAVLILRDTLGVGAQPIGLTNELAINQFIAHHSVVFQPNQLRMWVSTAPWQMGSYECYDLQDVFNRMEQAEPITSSMAVDSLQIFPDPAVQSGVVSQVKAYRIARGTILEHTKAKQPLPEEAVQHFISLNPNFYETYDLLARYYRAIGAPEQAAQMWQRALQQKVPKRTIRNEIEKNLR